MKPPELITENRKNGRQEHPIHPIRHLPMEQFRKSPVPNAAKEPQFGTGLLQLQSHGFDEVG